MADFIKEHWLYLLGALLLHALFAGVFGLTLLNMARNAPPPQLAIEAVIVDAKILEGADRRQQQQRQREREAEQAKQREAEAAERRREQQEQQRREAEQRAEQERQAEVQRRQEEEQRRVEEERVLRERQEAQRKQQQEEERQKQLAAERQRAEEIKRKQQEEAERRRKAEEARRQAAAEEELRRQLAEEEGVMQARSSPAMSQYIAMIRQHVERRWIRPASAQEGLECEVRVVQGTGGAVLSAKVTRCNGDNAVRQSIETAVLRSSPLPSPPDPRLFERNLVFIFRPES